MSGTHLFYNGVELRDCKTEAFSQQTVFDETTNLICSKFRIRVSSTVFGFYSTDSVGNTNYANLNSHNAAVETRIRDNDPVPAINPYDGQVQSADRATAVDRMQRIHERLSQPRGDFWYAIHDGKRVDVNESVYQVLLAATGSDNLTASGGGDAYFQDLFGNDIQIKYNSRDTASQKIPRRKCVDPNNGPKPLDVSIVDIFGGNAFRVTFEIEVHRSFCEIVESEGPPPWLNPSNEGPQLNGSVEKNRFVLSNTWSSEETVNEQWQRTRTIEGTLRVRDQQKWSQAFRSLCIPGLLPGYQRLSMRFASDPSNLVLKYRIEDRQAEAAPPLPAIDWEMDHTDSARNEYGQVERQVNITLIGPPRINRHALLGAALNLLDERFPGASKPADSDARVKGINPVPFLRQALIISQPAKRPTVQVLCNILITLDPTSGGAESFADAILKSSQFPSIAGYNPERWPTPRPFDLDTPAGIFATYLQNPCSIWHGIPAIQRMNIGSSSYDTADNNYPVLAAGAPKYWTEPDYMLYNSPTPLTDAPAITTNTPGTTGTPIASHGRFPYTHVDIDTRYSHDEGKMVLPLSGPRMYNAGTESEPNWKILSTMVAIPIHAGVMTRTITVNATRQGRPPELPQPAKLLIDPNGVVEHLIDKTDLVLDAPRLSEGNSHRIFSGQMRLTYALARPLSVSERYRAGNNPMLVSSPGHNWIPGTAIFSRNRVEYHEEPASAFGGTAYGAPFDKAYIPPGVVGNAKPEVGSGFNEEEQKRAEYPLWENSL